MSDIIETKKERERRWRKEAMDRIRDLWATDDCGIAEEESQTSAKSSFAHLTGKVEDPNYDGPDELYVPVEHVGPVMITAAIKELAMEVRRLRWHMENSNEG